MTGFSMANMVRCLSSSSSNHMLTAAGLHSRQVHDQVLRGQLPGVPRHRPSPQSTLDFPRYATHSPPFPTSPNLLTPQPGIWKVIRGWLDPVVANKVHFTNNAKEMEAFIPMKHIPKDLEGEEDWTYRYVEPVEGENAKLADAETRDRLLAARAGLYKEYEEATMEWIRNGGEGEKGAEIKERRNAIAAKLREDYWNVDPYLRARSYYDRIGVLLPGGKLDWYPDAKADAVTGAAAAPAAATAPETSADDVD